MFQKLNNSIKSDLSEKCPKCDEVDCDCIIIEDDNPVLVMHPVNSKQYGNFNMISPFHSNLFTMPPNEKIAPQNIQNQIIKPSDSISQYDDVHEVK